MVCAKNLDGLYRVEKIHFMYKTKPGPESKIRDPNYINASDINFTFQVLKFNFRILINIIILRLRKPLMFVLMKLQAIIPAISGPYEGEWRRLEKIGL